MSDDKKVVELKEKQNLEGYLTKEDLSAFEERFLELQAKSAERLQKVDQNKEVEVMKAKQEDSLIQWIGALRNNDLVGMRKAVKQAVTLDTDTATTAGNLVHPEIEKKVYRFLGENTVVYADSMKVTLRRGQGNTVRTQDIIGDVTVGWTDEGANKHFTNPTIGQPEAVLNKLTAIVRMTDEFDADAFLNPVDFLAERVGRMMRAQRDNALINGNGADIDGILATAGVTAIPLLSGSTSGDTSYDDLLAMKVEYLRQNYDFGAGVAYISPEVYQAILTSKDNEDAYLITNTTPSAVSPMGTTPAFLGQIPYKVSTFLPENVSDPATPFAFYTDLSQHNLVVEKEGLQVLTSQHAILTDGQTTENAFVQDKTFVRFVMRVGAVVVNPKGVIVLETPSASS